MEKNPSFITIKKQKLHHMTRQLGSDVMMLFNNINNVRSTDLLIRVVNRLYSYKYLFGFKH